MSIEGWTELFPVSSMSCLKSGTKSRKQVLKSPIKKRKVIRTKRKRDPFIRRKVSKSNRLKTVNKLADTCWRSYIHDPSCECTLYPNNYWISLQFHPPKVWSTGHGQSFSQSQASLRIQHLLNLTSMKGTNTCIWVAQSFKFRPRSPILTLRTKPLLGLSIYYYSPSFRRLMYILEWSSKVSHSCSTYGYRAILESILNYSKDATESQLASGLFFKDSAAKMNNCNPYSAGALVNYGLKKTRQSNSK